jgi:hypothetical protein
MQNGRTVDMLKQTLESNNQDYLISDDIKFTVIIRDDDYAGSLLYAIADDGMDYSMIDLGEFLLVTVYYDTPALLYVYNP